MLTEDEVRSALQSLTADQPPAPEHRLEQVRRRHHRHRRTQAIAATAAVLAIIGGVLAIVASTGTPGMRPRPVPPAKNSTPATSWQLPWHGPVSGTVVADADVGNWAESNGLSVRQLRWVVLTATPADSPPLAQGGTTGIFEASIDGQHRLVVYNHLSPAAHYPPDYEGGFEMLPAPPSGAPVIGAQFTPNRVETDVWVVGRPGLTGATVIALNHRQRITRSVRLTADGVGAVRVPRDPHTALLSEVTSGGRDAVTAGPIDGDLIQTGVSEAATFSLPTPNWPVPADLRSQGFRTRWAGSGADAATGTFPIPGSGTLRVALRCLGPTPATLQLSGAASADLAIPPCDGKARVMDTASVEKGQHLSVDVAAPAGTAVQIMMAMPRH